MASPFLGEKRIFSVSIWMAAFFLVELNIVGLLVGDGSLVFVTVNHAPAGGRCHTVLNP